MRISGGTLTASSTAEVAASEVKSHTRRPASEESHQEASKQQHADHVGVGGDMGGDMTERLSPSIGVT